MLPPYRILLADIRHRYFFAVLHSHIVRYNADCRSALTYGIERRSLFLASRRASCGLYEQAKKRLSR